MRDKDRLFVCRNCGQAVQGWHAANEWFDCRCPQGWNPREATADEYREAYGSSRYNRMKEED